MTTVMVKAAPADDEEPTRAGPESAGTDGPQCRRAHQDPGRVRNGNARRCEPRQGGLGGRCRPISPGGRTSSSPRLSSGAGRQPGYE